MTTTSTVTSSRTAVLPRAISLLRLALFVATSFLIGCDVSEPGEFPKTLLFASFEGSADPSYQAWATGSSLDSLLWPDQPRLVFVNDVPTGGGAFSLEIISTPYLDKYAGKVITVDGLGLPAGSHKYQLSLWAKVITGVGVAGLNVIDTSGGILFSVSRIRFDIADTSWTQYSAVTTLGGSDRIQIYSGTVTPLGTMLIDTSRTVRVDLVRLEQLD